MMHEFLSIVGTITLLYIGSVLFWAAVRELDYYFYDTDIRYLIAVAAGLVAILFFATFAHAAECLPSAPAVWAEHPGAHAYWHIRDGAKCWDTVPSKKPAAKVAAGVRGREVVERVTGRKTPAVMISAKRDTQTFVADSYAADVALSAADAPSPQERAITNIAALLTEPDFAVLDYYVRLNRLVDTVYERYLRETYSQRR